MTGNSRNVFFHGKHISAQGRSDPRQPHTRAKDKYTLFSLWNDTFVLFCFSKLCFPVFSQPPKPCNTVWTILIAQGWQGREVRAHFFLGDAAAMLEVLIANRRVAVKNPQPFPLGKQCSILGCPAVRGAQSLIRACPWLTLCRNVGLAVLLLWQRKNSLIKTQPWCSFLLEDELPASSRRLLARKYPS